MNVPSSGHADRVVRVTQAVTHDLVQVNTVGRHNRARETVNWWRIMKKLPSSHLATSVGSSRECAVNTVCKGTVHELSEHRGIPLNSNSSKTLSPMTRA